MRDPNEFHSTRETLSHMAVPVHTVSFVLNGQPVVVQGASPLISLNEWLRSQPQLWGTKLMCGEGGCGCCVVAITRQDPVTGADTTIAVNSVGERMLKGFRH